jgi:creatinine amidohydrolase/Fe(II)-dependent formamide hydrolase-like protein
MKNVFTCTKPLLIAFLLIVLVGGSSWQIGTKSKSESAKQFSDTTKPGNNSAGKDEPGIKDLDKVMKELEESMKKLEIEMKKFDGAKLEKEIKESMSKVDWKKIQDEIKASMDKIDWKKIHGDVEKAMKEAELNIKNIDMSKMEEKMKEMQEKLSKEQLNIKIDGKKIRQQVEEGMKKAKVGMEKAREEIKNLQEFTDELEKDGLINKKKGYKIQVKDGELYINGTKQSKETSDKCRKYYRKENFTINTDGDSIITL